MYQEMNDFYRQHREVTVGNILTKYYDSGAVLGRSSNRQENLPIVVALHGVATSSYMYRNLIAEFDGVVRLVIPDLPGFGRTEKKSPWALNYHFYYNWLEGFLRSILPYAEVPVHAHFIGHDFGALLALAWTIDHPGEVSSLFCMNTCVHLENAMSMPLMGIASLPIVGRGVGRLLAREAILSRLFCQGFKKTPERWLLDAYMAPYASYHSRAVLANFMHHLPSLAHFMWYIRRHLRHITCPSMFLLGKDDIFVGRNEARNLAELMPNAAYRCLPGVGHFPMDEAPEATNAEIISHLSHLGVEC